jgi:cytochrome c oxidase subunit IV
MSEHKITPLTYAMVFAALIVLTLVTLLLAGVELGAWHTAVGLAIAGTKATLIVLIFMHVWDSSRLTWVIVGTSLLFLAILLLMTLTDYLTRAWQM